MTAPPSDSKIFHITHLDNLQSIVNAECLWSDAQRILQGFSSTNIGHKHIKQRRLTRPVPVAAGGMLGDYVPFNFCPRSVMLYVVHRGHLDYGGGQEEVVHLVSTIQAAIATGRPWAFTDRHAELHYAEYFDDLSRLDEVDWSVMPRTYWSDPPVKEKRQAEFLVHDWFPWSAIRWIGTSNSRVARQVEALLGPAAHKPRVTEEPQWYY
ncbi:MAG: DUF4433 domain-containing protein [Polyangiaceae bacterium]|nr:DUF4433 domain-containing protein [Polyangiaceae bacterium]